MKNKIQNICIVAITRLGDMLQASPTLEGFKRENPDSKITVVIDKQFASICTGLPGIDEVYVLDLSMVVRCLHRGGDGIVEAIIATPLELAIERFQAHQQQEKGNGKEDVIGTHDAIKKLFWTMKYPIAIV